MRRPIKACPWLLHIIMGCLLSFPAFAQKDISTYQEALEAFKNQQYESALSGFIKARKSGINKPTLHYNLGVTYYKLKRYSKAISAFKRAAKTPSTRALSYYNIGLAEVRQKNEQQARLWFNKTIKNATDKPNLQTLAKEMLSRLNAAPTPSRQILGTWSGFYLADLGYDDNVTSRSETSASFEKDNFLSFYASANSRIQHAKYNKVYIKASTYLLQYKGFNQSDYANISMGAFTKRQATDWLLTQAADLTFSYLAGNPYTRSTNLRIEGKRKLTTTHKLRVIYDLSRIDEMGSSFDYLSGWQQQFSVRSTKKLKDNQVQLTYRLTLNNRHDHFSNNVFTSYSPTRHSLRAKVNMTLNATHSVSWEARYRKSDYADANNVGTLLIKRADERVRFIVKARHKVDRRTDLTTEYTYTKNDSNISRFQYNRNQINVGIMKRW